jgi:hypothetical protein
MRLLSKKFLSIYLLFLLIINSIPFSVSATYTPPYDVTYSHYVNPDNISYFYNFGYTLGTQNRFTPGSQFQAVILFFGDQKKDANGTWYVSGHNHPLYRSQIASLVADFARGYYAGVSGDNISILSIIISTTNNGNYVTTSAGAEWANTILDADNLITPYESQVIVYGGNDMELGYSPAQQTINWINGYSNVTGRKIYFDTGDAAGCPTSSLDYTSSTVCSTKTSTGTNTYTINQVLFKTYGAAPALPFPQIYTTSTSNAYQWQHISKYGGNISIQGVLTQYQACIDNNQVGCADVNETPYNSYDKLLTRLRSSSITYQSNIPYSTDVTWDK